MATDTGFLEYAVHDSELVKFKDYNISFATLALHYGLAAFGGIRAIPFGDNKIAIIRFDKHVKRLSQSARILRAEHIDQKYISDSIIKLINNSPTDKSYYIRPLVYNASIGLAPRLHNSKWSLGVYGIELGDYISSEGIKCCFSSWFRQKDNTIPARGKISGSYITSALSKTEAVERGFDESILLSADGKISEASAMNIFIVRDGKLITTRITNDILEGISRACVIELAKDLGLEVVERDIDKSELLIADEIFLTGTAARVAPVVQIESFKFKKGEISLMLQDKFNKIVTGQDPKYYHWNTVFEVK